jgi:hypothetical protein
MKNIKTNIGNLFQENTGKIKVISAGLITTAILLTLSTISFGADTDFQTEHQELDQKLLSHFEGWVQANGMRTFCLPKADLLVQEIDIRTKLGDDVSDLQARLDRVTNNCNKVVKQVLFQ